MDEQHVQNVIDEFSARAIEAMKPPRDADWFASLEFECRRASGALVGHSPDADGMALAQHVMLALRIDGDIRAGIRTAFLWYAEKILDNEMEGARVRLHNALLGRPYGPA